MTPCPHVRRLFLFKAFQGFAGHLSSYCCAQNFDIVKLNFFTFLPCIIITHLTAFSITFLTHLKNNGHPLLGLSFKVFTFDRLFTYIVQTSSTVYQFLWLKGKKQTVKTDAWALELYSTNSGGLHFREVGEKIKRKRQKITKKIYLWHLGQKLKNIIISSNFSVKLLWKVI